MRGAPDDRGAGDATDLVGAAIAAALVFLVPLAAGYLVALLGYASGVARISVAARALLVGLGLLVWAAFVVHALRRARVWMLALGFAVVACGALLTRATYDVSWDGQAWHSFLIERLLGGWNPLTTRLAPPGLLFHMIGNHYPKLAEIVASEIIALTGHLDDGRWINFLALPPAFLIALASLTALRVPRVARVALSLLAVANPVVLCQLFTFYVDGLVYLTLVCFAGALLLLWSDEVRAGGTTWVLLAVSALLVANLKTPALAYALAFLACAAASLAWRGRVRRAIAMTVLFAAVVISTGYHPYVQNLRDFGNPLYPSLGSDGEFAIDALVAPQRPAGFADDSRFGRLARSIFSRSDGSTDAALVKLPWSVAADELRPFANPDVRKGGFGPLFALALVLSLLGLGISTRSRTDLSRWSLPLVVALSALIHAESWWARYAPQLWLLPLTAAAAILAAKPRALANRSVAASGTRGGAEAVRGSEAQWPERGTEASFPTEVTGRALAWATVLVLAVDVTLIAPVNVAYTLRESRAVRAQLERARQLPEACFAIRVDFSGPKMRLRELGVRYRLVEESECAAPVLVGNYARFCAACPARAGQATR